MQTLYIDRRDTKLDIDRERILVHSPSLPKPLSIAFAYLSPLHRAVVLGRISPSGIQLLGPQGQSL